MDQTSGYLDDNYGSLVMQHLVDDFPMVLSALAVCQSVGLQRLRPIQPVDQFLHCPDHPKIARAGLLDFEQLP